MTKHTEITEMGAISQNDMQQTGGVEVTTAEPS